MSDSDLVKTVEPLNNAEAEELSVCEAEIADGIEGFQSTWRALAQIKAHNLWREKYTSFMDYCDKRWPFTRQHIHRLIEAVPVFENLPQVQSERQARALKKYEKDLQVIVWRISEACAVKIDGKPHPTAGMLKDVGEALEALLITGAMEDANGEMQPVGVLLDAEITERVYERLMRQKQVIRDKLSTQSTLAASGAKTATTTAATPDAPAEGGKAPQRATPDVKVRSLLRLIETWVDGEDHEMADRRTALHPGLHAAYHYSKAILGLEKGENEITIKPEITTDDCDRCDAVEVATREVIFTNNHAQRLSSARLALCGDCVEIYKALNAVAQGVGA